MIQGEKDAHAGETLRDRKRRETRCSIERAAISLVSDHGYEKVTVAMICERAVVSQGTFFNYFPTKDAAIVGMGPIAVDPLVVRAAYDRMAPGSPYHCTLTLFLQVVRSVDGASDIAVMRAQLVAQTPTLMKLFLEGMFEFVSEFRGVVTQYLEEHPERRTCAPHLTAAEEAQCVVDQALEAAKFALMYATAHPAEAFPEVVQVEAMVRRIIG